MKVYVGQNSICKRFMSHLQKEEKFFQCKKKKKNNQKEYYKEP